MLSANCPWGRSSGVFPKDVQTEISPKASMFWPNLGILFQIILSESHLLTAKPCSSTLGHCNFAKLDVCQNYGLNSNLTLAKGFGCRLLHVPKENSPQSSHLGMNNLGLEAEILMSSVKKHKSPVDVFPHCLMASFCSCMQEASSSQQSSHILHLIPSKICTPECILFSGFYTQEPTLLPGSPVQFDRCTGTGLQVPFWGHAEPIHVPGISPLRLGAWAGGAAAMAFAPISQPKPHNVREHWPSRQAMSPWRHLAILVCHQWGMSRWSTMKGKTDHHLWSAIKKYRWKVKESNGDVFCSPSPLGIDSIRGHPSSAWCRADVVWCYPAGVGSLKWENACQLSGKKWDLQLLIWLCGVSCHLGAALPLRKVNDISNPLSCL